MLCFDFVLTTILGLAVTSPPSPALPPLLRRHPSRILSPFLLIVSPLPHRRLPSGIRHPHPCPCFPLFPPSSFRPSSIPPFLLPTPSSRSAASKSLASKSKSLASVSKSLAIKATAAASKASSIALKSASVSSAAAASLASAASASSSLASLQSAAASSASSLSAVASANSVAAESIASAQASIVAARASITSAAGDLSRSIDSATASAGQGASSLSSAQASLASARASLSADAATITAQAQSVSSASAAVDSSASVLSVRSESIDQKAASLSADVDSVGSSFGSISSALSSQSDALAASTSAYAAVISSISAVESQQSVAATALAASSASIASQTSSLAAAATATGLATACQGNKFLANGHCYDDCPAQFPVEFARDGTFGLCCTAGSKECVAGDAKSATVCADNYLHTVLDKSTGAGTCTTTCCTVEDSVVYKFEQLGGVYPTCVAADGCLNGNTTADAVSGLCCDKNVKSCQDQTPTGATSCNNNKFFAPNMVANSTTGSCVGLCPKGTFYPSSILSANKTYIPQVTCLGSCPVAGAAYTIPGTDNVNSRSVCCPDAHASSCTYQNSASVPIVSTGCVTGYVLDGESCVPAGSCSNGASDNGANCCPASALSCDSKGYPTSCGVNKAGTQTYLTPAKSCVVEANCPNGVSALSGGRGLCCADTGATSCSSALSDSATSCNSTLSYFLSPSAASATSGSCIKYCEGSKVDPVSNQCVATCPTSSVTNLNPTTHQATCCPAGSASCDGTGAPTTCTKGLFVQPNGQSCGTTCPSSSVKSSNGGFCCAKGTSTCSGVALHGAALACGSGFSLLDKTCVASCPASTTTTAKDANGNNVCNCAGQNFDGCNYDGTAKSCAIGYTKSTDGFTCAKTVVITPN